MSIIFIWNKWKCELKQIFLLIYHTYLEDELQAWLNSPWIDTIHPTIEVNYMTHLWNTYICKQKWSGHTNNDSKKCQEIFLDVCCSTQQYYLLFRSAGDIHYSAG